MATFSTRRATGFALLLLMVALVPLTLTSAQPTGPSASPEASPSSDLPTSIEIRYVEIVDVEDQGPIEIPANTDIDLTVINATPTSHDLVIEDTEFETANIPGGESETITINLPPGDSIFFCSIGGHRLAGMEGILRAVDNSATPAASDATPEAAGSTTLVVQP